MSSWTETVQVSRLVPPITARIEVDLKGRVKYMDRMKEMAPALPGTPVAHHTRGFIWPHDGAFIAALGTETRVRNGTYGCYRAFPTEDAAIMFVLMSGGG